MALVTKIARRPASHVVPVGRRPICRDSAAIDCCCCPPPPPFPEEHRFGSGCVVIAVQFQFCTVSCCLSSISRLSYKKKSKSTKSPSLGHVTGFLAALGIVSHFFVCLRSCDFIAEVRAEPERRSSMHLFVKGFFQMLMLG